MLEYDLEIKPTKLVKGLGLEKLMTDANCESLKVNFLSNVSSGLDSWLQVIKYFSLSPWYNDIFLCFTNLTGTSRIEQDQIHVCEVESIQVLYFEPVPVVEGSRGHPIKLLT